MPREPRQAAARASRQDARAFLQNAAKQPYMATRGARLRAGGLAVLACTLRAAGPARPQSAREYVPANKDW